MISFCMLFLGYSIPLACAQPPPIPEVWIALADCESGYRDEDGEPIPGSARWDLDVGSFDGGLQFHPTTWLDFRPPVYPDHAHEATPRQQVDVARKVLASQGWGAWPVCSTMIGARQ